VVQSLAIVNDTVGIIVVNNSAKLEVVDLETFKTIREPIPAAYPRQFIQVTPNTGYLTGGSLKGYVYIMDLGTFEITDSIEAGYGPDALVKLDHSAYVANSGGWGIDSTIFKISTSVNQIMDTFQVGKAPADLVMDHADKLWVYCKGQAVYNWDPPYNLISETDALLQKVDIISGNILWQGIVGKAGDYTATPPRIAASPDGDFIYFLRPDGVYKTSSGSPDVPEAVLIEGSYYGMDVNPGDGNIYVFESVFTGNGTMKIFSENGILLSEGTVGIAPNGAVFH
jgi:DNA-binding beta-propeller fold protein YncE